MAIHRLSATKLAALKKPGYHGDGGGLYFRVLGGSRTWIFRYARYGRTHDMGGGRFPEVGLARAREWAFECRQKLARGIDPLVERNAERAAARIQDAKLINFDDAAEAYIAAHANGWRGDKNIVQWRNSLKAHVSPTLGRLPVREIDTPMVLRCLEPIWVTTGPTAARLRGRIEAILDWAKVRGYRTGENPARWKGHLDHLLASPSKVNKVEHRPALPYSDVGKFMDALGRQGGIAVNPLRFLILTAARTAEVLHMTWNEINLDERVWVVPANRMKGGREHRVPLSDAAVEILRAQQAIRRGDYVFEGAKAARPLSPMSLLMLLRRMGRGDVTSHGFRSTFRDWAAERTAFENFVVEMALAHAIPSAVEAAYRRGDLFAKRKKMMAAWAAFCATPSAPEGNVLPIGARRK
jgi:integrase